MMQKNKFLETAKSKMRELESLYSVQSEIISQGNYSDKVRYKRDLYYYQISLLEDVFGEDIYKM